MMDHTSNFPFFPYQDNTRVDEYTDLSEIVNGVVFSSFASPEDASMVSSDSYFPDTFPTVLFDHDSLMINEDHDILEKISRTDIDEICDWIYSGHREGTSSSAEIFVSADEWSPSPSLESSQIAQLPKTEVVLDIPRKEDIKLDNELSLIHLLKAYAEAMGDGNKGSLAKMIFQSINEKSNPKGNLVEQVAYHMFKSEDGDHGEYLRQESINNIAPALNLLYQTLICGRFAHNAANAAILESLPDDVAALHIVDFDIGEGIQWPALIEALSRKQKTVRLTAIVGSSPSCWEFEETKKRLLDCGRECGLKLYIEEKCIEDFAEEMRSRRRKNRRGGRDWLVFNSMAALPHMGRRRRRRTVEFLKVAEELLADFDGILTFGDGEGGEETRNCSSFESYFEKLLEHYKALLEALECNLPKGDFAEARMAMESLFIAPMMRPSAWLEEWKEMGGGGGGFESVLEGRRVRCESVAEAKVMVDEREDWYNVRMRENEMELRWKETVLVKVSTYCSRRWR